MKRAVSKEIMKNPFFILLLILIIAAAIFFGLRSIGINLNIDASGNDTDGDTIININNPDADGDGVIDKYPRVNPGDDIDGDGIINILDPDMDGDGLLNCEDPDADGDGVMEGLEDVNPNEDFDGDGIINIMDPDMDGDGIINCLDPDMDGDGEGELVVEEFCEEEALLNQMDDSLFSATFTEQDCSGFVKDICEQAGMGVLQVDWILGASCCMWSCGGELGDFEDGPGSLCKQSILINERDDGGYNPSLNEADCDTYAFGNCDQSGGIVENILWEGDNSCCMWDCGEIDWGAINSCNDLEGLPGYDYGHYDPSLDDGSCTEYSTSLCDEKRLFIERLSWNNNCCSTKCRTPSQRCASLAEDDAQEYTYYQTDGITSDACIDYASNWCEGIGKQKADYKFFDWEERGTCCNYNCEDVPPPTESYECTDKDIAISFPSRLGVPSSCIDDFGIEKFDSCDPVSGFVIEWYCAPMGDQVSCWETSVSCDVAYGAGSICLDGGCLF